VKGYPVPNLHSPDSYVLEVIAAILSSGKSSRLYQDLIREKQLVLEVDADHSLLSRDPALFYLSAVPMPGKDTDDVEKALDQEVERLQKETVTGEEIERAKNQLEAAFVYGEDSLFSQAILLARHEITADWKKLDDYLPSIRKVTAADIQRVARQYLVRENSTVGILVPLPVKEGKPASQPSIREREIR
jgi:zinc protease